MKLKHPSATIMVILILSLTFVFLSVYKSPKTIDVERAAILFTESDPASGIPTTIIIKGTLYRPIFAQDKFSGKIAIEALDFTKQDDTLDVIITQKGHGINMGGLWYQEKSSPQHLSQSSLIWFDNNFENLNIWINTTWLGRNDGNNKNSFLVTGSNYEEALALQQKMSESFGEPFVRDAFVP